MKPRYEKAFDLDEVIRILQNPNVSDDDAALAVCNLSGTDTFKYVVALLWGAGRKIPASVPEVRSETDT
jgi:hypothetical protein